MFLTVNGVDGRTFTHPVCGYRQRHEKDDDGEEPAGPLYVEEHDDDLVHDISGVPRVVKSRGKKRAVKPKEHRTE